MANLKAALALLLDLPCTFAITSGGAASSDTIAITYRHKGVIGEDLPIILSFSGATNLQISMGYTTSATLIFATSSTGAGSVVINVGGTTITAALAGVTTAANIGVAVAAAVNGGAYPVTATDLGSGAVQLFYADGRTVRRVTCRVIDSSSAANGTTVNGVAAGSYATIGTATSNTPGAGAPTFTTALVNVAALAQGFGTWLSTYSDAATLGTIDSFIESQADGYTQKDQQLFFGSADKLSTAGAIPAATTPALTATIRGCESFCKDSPQQALEIAARVAANYLNQDYPPHNYDGDILSSNNPVIPLLLPHVNDRSPQPDQNAAMKTYFMTPIVVDATNRLTILRGVTTSNSSNELFAELCTPKQIANMRISLRQYLTPLFMKKSIKTSGEPKTPNTFTTKSVRDAIVGWMQGLDDIDEFDGAEAAKGAVSVNVNPVVRSRLDVFVPLVLMRNIHQLGVTVGPQ